MKEIQLVPLVVQMKNPEESMRWDDWLLIKVETFQ